MGDIIFNDLLRSTTETSVSIRVLVDGFIAYCSDIELSPATIKTRQSHLSGLLRFCEKARVDDITAVNNLFFDKYFAYYRQTHKKSSTNTDRRIIKVFLVWVRDYKEIEIGAKPEFIHVLRDEKRDPEAIDAAIIRNVIANCPNTQDRLVIALFIETGIRISELCSIRVGDINGVCLSVVGKGNKPRKVYVTDRLACDIRDFTTGRDSTEYMFTNKQDRFISRTAQDRFVGRKMRPDTIWRHVKYWFKTIAGIDMHPHQLRHSFAVYILEDGCDIVAIKDLLGHTDINTTMVYLKLTDKRLQQSHTKHMRSFLP